MVVMRWARGWGGGGERVVGCECYEKQRDGQHVWGGG